MSSTGYYVVGDHDVWVIECAVGEGARSMSRNAAMAFAACAAEALDMRGERAQVCVLDDDGRLRSV
jgi:hypothetical protein